MAEKELWEISLDIKTEKFNDAQKRWDESLKGIETREKRLTEALKNEGKLQVANELTNIKERAKIRNAAIDAELKAERDAAARIRKQREADAKFTGQSSQIRNFGQSDLSGQVGSQAYINMLKSMRNELSPASAEFQRLTGTIKQMQGELDKVNKNSGVQAFKNLTISIKETKGELAKLAAEQKVGTEEWRKYSDRLRELQRQKQLIQRETKLTSQQLLAMSRDLTVVAYGLRQIGQDAINLSKGEMSAEEMAAAIGNIGIQTLIVLPAIHGLVKALEAAGIVSASTIAKLSAMAGTLGTLAIGITAVTVAYTAMAGAITHASDMLGRIGAVLSGQMSYWDALKQNLRDVTFGLIDLTDQSDNAARSLEQLLNLSVASGKQFQNLLDQQNYESKFKPGGEFYNKYNTEEIKALIENYKQLQNVKTEYEQQQEREDQFTKNKTDILYQNSKKKSSPGSSSRVEREADAIGDLIKSVNNEIELKKQLGQLNTQFLIDEQNILKAADNENLKLEDRIKLLQEIDKLQGRIAVWLTGGKSINDFQSKGIDINNGGLNFRRGFKLSSANANDFRGDMSSQEMEDLIRKELESEKAILGYTEGAYNNFKGMLEATGLMKGDFAIIIQTIDSVIKGGSSLFGFVTSLLGIFGGPVGAVVGGIGGGGIPSVIPGIGGGGLRYGNLPNVTPPQKSMSFNPTIIVQSEVEKTKAIQFFQNHIPAYQSRALKSKLG